MQPEAVRPKLERVRDAIRRAVPEAVEGIAYRMPGYRLHGKPLLYFAGFKEHYSLFAASGTFFAALEEEDADVLFVLANRAREYGAMDLDSFIKGCEAAYDIGYTKHDTDVAPTSPAVAQRA